MVHEAQKALALLKEQDIAATLVDLYSLPFDETAIRGLVQDNQGQVLTIEDNYGAGIGSAIAEMLATHRGAYTLTQMHVRRIPKSGRTPDEVLRALQLSASDIAQTAVKMLDVATLARAMRRRDTYERARLQGRLQWHGAQYSA